ncbi:hypothetical protein AVEN_133947-1 [Araneus ventricosus]|uniref:Sushi domain-containing protein n=1 Tax=Araneus ventricosus TaxID=182803 RepID=A0A4Y2UGR3_ARAVE|nr:hypothetical protein AVEN_5230-1 [Araneus ventricosus]GBO10800.1 hypothetical protein AVEN_133947-1 [Araneus ventricosus]
MALSSTVWCTLLALLGLSIRPDAPPTEGIRFHVIETYHAFGFSADGISCRGLEVKDGSANCFKDGPKTVCEVFCDGKRQGGFTCTADEGWTPELPPCAKPIEDRKNFVTVAKGATPQVTADKSGQRRLVGYVTGKANGAIRTAPLIPIMGWRDPPRGCTQRFSRALLRQIVRNLVSINIHVGGYPLEVHLMIHAYMSKGSLIRASTRSGDPEVPELPSAKDISWHRSYVSLLLLVLQALTTEAALFPNP